MGPLHRDQPRLDRSTWHAQFCPRHAGRDTDGEPRSPPASDTIVREGFLLYGSSKRSSAMAVLAAFAGSGVTWRCASRPTRGRSVRPAIVVPPLLWLLSDEALAANGETHRRGLDTNVSPAQAAAGCTDSLARRRADADQTVLSGAARRTARMGITIQGTVDYGMAAELLGATRAIR